MQNAANFKQHSEIANSQKMLTWRFQTFRQVAVIYLTSETGMTIHTVCMAYVATTLHLLFVI